MYRQVPEAIRLLRDNKCYREAVAMARARLSENDPLLVETVRTWALRLKNGEFFLKTYDMKWSGPWFQARLFRIPSSFCFDICNILVELEYYSVLCILFNPLLP